MEALIQHFLIYSQGFTVPAGDVYVPIEGPRGEHGTYIVSDGTNRLCPGDAIPPDVRAQIRFEWLENVDDALRVALEPDALASAPA